MESIKKIIIRDIPIIRIIKVPLKSALEYYEEKKEISCAEYENLYNSSKTQMKKADREELLKHFKLKPDSSGYEFVKEL